VPGEIATRQRRRRSLVRALMTAVALVAVGCRVAAAVEEARYSGDTAGARGDQPAKGGRTVDVEASENRPMPAVDIRLEGSGPEARFPRLAIHFTREGHEQQTLNVRFPEGIAATDPASGKGLSFYVDVRSPDWPATLECEPVDLPVTWEGGPKALGYTMRLDNGMVLKSSAKVDGPSVIFSHVLENTTPLDLRGVKIVTCVQLQLAPDFADFLMERTGVPVGGRFRLLRDITPGFEPYSRSDAVRQRFLAFREGAQRWFVGTKHVSPHPGHPDDPDQTITFWQAEPAIDNATIATVSRTGDMHIATSCRAASSVWTNPGISCHHADATVASCPPGGAAELTVRVSFVAGSF